jgi:hypothetical protein
MVSSLLLRSLLVAGGVAAQQTYQLDTAYSGATFFDGWDFFDGPDPTVGFVTYVFSLFPSSTVYHRTSRQEVKKGDMAQDRREADEK